MKKWIQIPLIIFCILIVTLAIVFYSLTSSKTIKAQLYLENGAVLVNGNLVQSDILLKEKDLIETLEDGEATVVLYESVVISLDPNTKITLEDLSKKHPQLIQEGGSTWSKFTKLLGVEEYTLSAGTTVASVRGTEFGLTENKIFVSEGQVDYDFSDENFLVEENNVVEGGKKREMTEEEKQIARQKTLRIIKQLKKLRQAEVDKHPKLLQTVKSRFEISDSDIRQAFEDADKGNLDINEAKSKSPIKIASINRIADLTLQIRKMNERLESLR